jgi:hypothetical protein
MNFDYSPLNPIIWSVFLANWVLIGIIGNAYRKKYRFIQNEQE